jgi:hypothetical protein
MTFIKLFKVNKRITNNETQYYLTEISVNASQISFMSENTDLKSLLSEGKLNLNLNKGANFTDLRLHNANEITVIGSPSVIESKILTSNKKLLRG